MCALSVFCSSCWSIYYNTITIYVCVCVCARMCACVCVCARVYQSVCVWCDLIG